MQDDTVQGLGGVGIRANLWAEGWLVDAGQVEPLYEDKVNGSEAATSSGGCG